MRWFVSRHPGARSWVKSQQLNIDRFASHLDIEQIQTGDTVIGTLPIHLAQQVCHRGGRYLHLTVNLPEHLRGKELTEIDLLELDAQIQEYIIRKA